MQHNVVECSVAQCSVMQCSTVQYSIVCSAIQCAVQYSAEQCSAVRTCKRALSSVSKVSPSLLMSSWNVVMPVSLPATNDTV